MTKTIPYATLALTSLLLGCSSGGGGTPATPVSYENISVAGAAAKGIIQGATITATELDGQGNELATVAITTTDENGHYTLTLDNYSGGPLLIRLDSDAGTTMKCDAISGCGRRLDDQIIDTSNPGTVDYGEWYIPAAITLTALLPRANANETIAVNLTPYTHLAAQATLGQGAVSATAAANTNSEVANLLGGIDILNTTPIDITDNAAVAAATPTQLVYSALSTAIANLAPLQGEGEPDLAGALQRLSASFSAGRFPADDSGSSQDASLYSLAEIVDAARASLGQAGRVDVSGVLTALESAIAAASDSDGDGVTELDPEPSSSAADSELAKVKALMTDIRTWGNIVTSELESSSQAFEEQIDLTLQAANAINEVLISELFYLSADAIAHYNSANKSLNTYYVSSPRWPNGFTSGLINNPSAGRYTIDNATVESASPNGVQTLTLAVNVPVNNTTGQTFTYGIESAQISGPYTDATISEGSFTLNLSQDYTVGMDSDPAAAEAAVLPILESIDINLALSVTQKWNLEGTIAATQASGGDEQIDVYYEDPITFTGQLRASVYPIVENTPPEITWLAPGTLDISGSASNSVTQLSARFAANFPNGASFTPVGGGQIESPDNYVEVDATPPPEEPDSLGLSFSLQLEGLPEATVRITGDRTGLQAGNVTTTIAYDNRLLEIATSGDALAGTLASAIVITNQDGARLDLDLSHTPLSGTFSYNGVDYASLSETDSGYLKIEYIDGTFEIF